MPLPALSLPRRPSARAAGACACVLSLLAGGWLWLRDSRLVAVDQVSVTGLSGSEAPRVRATNPIRSCQPCQLADTWRVVRTLTAESATRRSSGHRSRLWGR